MIFPKLRYEKIIQENDKLRLDASQSFATASETIEDVLIKPEDTESFISVFNTDSKRWYLDWAYDEDELKVVTVRVVTDNGDKEREFSLEVISEENDALLSSDQDLFPYEPNIYRYLPQGKSSFIYAHRAAQSKILAYLDEQRIWKQNSKAYTKEDLVNVEDVEFKDQFKMWSTFQTLLIIFESAQVSTNDLFQQKRMEYEKEMRIHRNRASLRLDSNGDGKLDPIPRNIRTTTLVRR